MINNTKNNPKVIITTIAVGVMIATALPALAQGVDGNIRTRIQYGTGTSSDPVPMRVRIEARMGSTSTSSEVRARIETRNEEQRASTTQMRTEARVNALQDKDGAMIQLRIENMNRLLERIQNMKQVSAQDKASLVDSINAEIANLESLKAEVGSSTSTTTLQNDRSSITKTYRIFALVEPKARIIAAADRVLNIVSSMNTISAKIQARIASSSITLNSDASAALSDFTVQIDNASSVAQAAIDSITNLTSDNGDATIAASNRAALQSSRQKVVDAEKSLTNARKDLETVIRIIIRSNGNTVQSTSTVTASTTE